MDDVKRSPQRARVLLLNPPTAAVSTEVLLNLGYLAASLRKAGHEARIIDATAPHRPYGANEIIEVIRDFRPHFIGVTLTIVCIPQTYTYLRGLRAEGVPIVAGGPHPNSLPEEALDNGADIVAIGEGEETIVELADYFLGARGLDSIAGLCYKDKNGTAHYTPSRRLIQDIDTIPMPDFKDFPIKNYTGSDDVNSNPIFWSMFTSRGCPFNCTFCSSHNVFGRTTRMRSSRNIFNEIKGMVGRFGVEKITFQDDEILCSKKRFIDLCDMILDARLKVKMSIRTRVSSIDKDILCKAKQVGLTRVSFGIESWNDETLNRINKMYTVATVQEKFKVIKDTGFPYISFNNIIGFPWETKKHFQDNIQEISKIPEGIAYFTNAATPIPYPKTALYDEYHRQFGFTDWWLDPKNHSVKTDNTEKPFFMLFAFMMVPLYKKDIFWKIPRREEKAMRTFAWKLFRLFLKRHYAFHRATMIYMLSRLSHAVWKRSPGLEQLLFRPLRNKDMMKLRDEIIFISKY